MTFNAHAKAAGEDVVMYSLEVAPAYQAIRRLLVQFAGILILQSGSARGAPVDLAICQLAADSLAELTQTLATVRPPFRLRARHSQLQRCVSELKLVDEYMRSAKQAKQEDANMIATTRARLENVLGFLKTVEDHATGLTVVDFTQSCACHAYLTCEHASRKIARA